MSLKEGAPRVRVRCDALKKSKGIADPIRLVGGECRWVNDRVDVDDLLE